MENEKSWKQGNIYHKRTEDTEEYIFTMKNMKLMKIIHESANERTNDHVHPLTKVFDFFRVFSCLSWLKLVNGEWQLTNH